MVLFFKNERFEGLRLMAIHKSRELGIDEVININWSIKDTFDDPFLS